MKPYFLFCLLLLCMAMFNQNIFVDGIRYEGLQMLKPENLPQNYAKNQRNNYTRGCSPINKCRGTYD